MSEPPLKPLHRRLWRWMRQNEDAAFAFIMATIAALFIVGIVSAFNFAASDVAESPSPPATTATRMPSQTIGAGGDRPRPPQHDPREDEQAERPR